MAVVVKPGHPLLSKRKPGWKDLAAMPCVVPPPWASLRVKLDQMFLREGLHPPADILESASFLNQLSFLQQRDAAAFMSRGVALQFQRQGVLKVLSIKVPIELPPVGLITLRGRRCTPSTERLIECLRLAARMP